MPNASLKTGKAGGGTNGMEELSVEEGKSAVVAAVADFLRKQAPKAGGGSAEFELSFDLNW